MLDVEPLFDGRTLYFHFMCDVEPQLEKYVDQLARLYERQLLESEFAQSLEEGCGPNCGTELAKNDCGSGCAVCHVGSICRNKT